MYRNARIHVADILDDVFVEATVFTADWKAEAPAQVNSFAITVKSTGEEETAEWLRDALVALIETL